MVASFLVLALLYVACLRVTYIDESISAGSRYGQEVGGGRELGWLPRIKRMLRMSTREDVMEGYVVDVIPAVAILQGSHRDAAACWERNTPHLLKGREEFVFPASCCSETTAVPERGDTPPLVPR